VNGDNQQLEAFLGELNAEIGWEWKWEKLNRFQLVGSHWVTWIARILVLAMSTYAATNYKKDASWLPPVLVLVAVLSVTNVGMPLLASALMLRQRQEVHDRNARAYCVIKTQLLSGQITLAQAVARYADIRRKPTEPDIRQTP
jgi:hypothetical protein